MAEIASAYVTLMPSAKGFGSSAQRQIGPQMDSAAKTSGSRFGKIFAYSSMGPMRALGAAALGFFAADKISGFLKDAVGGASDLAESTTKIKAIFGSASKQVQAFAGQGAKALGQTKLEVLDAAATFGTFGKAAGLSGRDLGKFSTGFASLSTDMASFFNTSPAEATEAIGAALRGEAEPIRKYGVLLDDATLRQEALRLGLIKTTKQALTPQQKVLAAQAQIYKQTKDAQGDFQRTSGGLANQQRILSAQWSDMKTSVGAGLLPIITRFTTFLNSSVVPAISKFVAQMKSGTGLGGQFAEGFRSAFSTLKTGVTVVLANKEAVVAFLAVLAGFQILRSITLGVMAFNAALAANPIGLVVVAIAALAAGLVYAYKNSATFRNIVNGAFAAIKAVAIPVLNALKTGVGAAVNFIRDHWKLLVAIIGGPLVIAAALVIKHWNAIKSFVTGAVSAVIGFVKSNWQSILATMLAGPFGLAVSLIARHWDAIKSAVSAGIGKVIGFVKALPGKILSALGGLGSLLYNAGRELIAGLISGILSKIGDIGGAMSGIASKIKGYLPGSPVKEGPLTSWNGGAAGIRLMELLAKGIRDGSVHVSKAMVNALEKIRDGLKDKRAGIKSILDGLNNDFASLRDGVASSLTGDLFGATFTEAITDEAGNITQAAASAGSNFVSNLLAKKGELTNLIAAFKTLRGWGMKPEFLSSLFASGNGAVALDLAAMGKSGALEAGSLFGEVTSLGQQLGTAVATNDPISNQIKLTNKKLDRVIDALDAVGPAVGAALNSAAADAQRGKKGKR